MSSGKQRTHQGAPELILRTHLLSLGPAGSVFAFRPYICFTMLGFHACALTVACQAAVVTCANFHWILE